MYRFAGECSDAALSSATTALKAAIAVLPQRLQKHLYASFIELFQNVERYGADPQKDTESRPYGEIHVCASEAEGCSIHAVNLICAQDRARLETTLSDLQGLDRAGLSERYREQLPRPCAKDAPSGAAGLGLIELAKRSRLSFSFQPVHKSCYLFTISLNFTSA